MRKAPSVQTLKKLFASSGNLCAYPGCGNRLVDDDGNLIGQVCHIEAADVGGERYNPGQSDEERADFSNLLVLCANHHKVTNNETTYTVQVLKEMKAKHEAKYISDQYKVNDKVVDQATKQVLSQSNVNSGSGRQNNYQAQTMTVTNGITATDVVSIVQVLYDANFPKLALIAQEEAAKNVAKFEENFRAEISKKLSPDELTRFSNPDIQVALYQAVQSAARKDSDILRKMLSDLVIHRVKNEENELKQKVLNEAIPTVAKITTDQMKMLTVCFLVKHASFRGNYTWETFKLAIARNIKPFLGFNASRAEVFHLQYAGCGKVEEVFSFDLANAWRENYSFVFLKSLDEPEIQALAIPDEQKSNVFVQVDDKVYFSGSTKSEFKKMLEQIGIVDHVVEQAVNLYEQKLMTKEEIRGKFEQEMPWIKELFEKINNTSLNHLSLTSVGQAIAIAYFEQIVGEALNIDIWIN